MANDSLNNRDYCGCFDLQRRGWSRDRKRKYRVRFENLRLSRKDNIKILYQRIRAAADSVCPPVAHTHSLAIHPNWLDCRALEVANAVAEIDHPLLTEYHRQLTSHALEGA